MGGKERRTGRDKERQGETGRARERHPRDIRWFLLFLDYLQDYIAGRCVIDAHFGRHHHHVILSDVEARWAQAISAKQKFKKVLFIITSVSQCYLSAVSIICRSFSFCAPFALLNIRI